MPASPHHSQVPTNGSPTPGKCQGCGMEEQEHDGLGEVCFHFQNNGKMVRKSPATAGALKGEWPQANQTSFDGVSTKIEFCSKLHCSSSLWHTQHLCSLRLWSQTLKFQELPLKHQGGAHWGAHRLSTASQNFLTNLGRRRILSRATDKQLQSHFQAISDMPLLQGGSVPTGTSSTMASISSDPYSHPHNGKKILL